MNPGHRIRVVTRQCPNLLRGSVIVVTLIAWFSISNHCALAVFTSTPDAAAIHAHCHGSASEPVNNNTEEEVPCCKVLRATITGSIDVPSHQQTGVQDFVATELLSIEEDHVQPLPEEIDTGPPFASSYAELILQRSVLAHAPPSLV